MGSPSGTYLVHLVWAPLGPQLLGRFVDAYRRNDPGVPHTLLILLNGFQADDDLGPWRRELAGVEHEELRLPDPVLDLEAYRDAALRVQAERYCFVNSYSEPLVGGWVAKLDGALSLPGVGLAGATGSWASTRSLKFHLLHLPSAYRGVLPEPRIAAEQFMALQSEVSGVQPPSSRLARLRSRIDTLYEIPERILPFDAFPAYHVRTNAFMITHETLFELSPRAVSDKQDAYKLENGRRSITRQLQRKARRTVVVDRDGVVYDHDRWHLSRTFWQSDQEGLLVADNQTSCYAEADATRRRLLSGFAWGPEADPHPP
ncbi:MAG TPA: hypothetical protein VKG62_06825 [Solirubrobacteraceae bacterium]|nr:hypothetical protein [Solirubrobacteraceae bacterium]